MSANSILSHYLSNFPVLKNAIYKKDSYDSNTRIYSQSSFINKLFYEYFSLLYLIRIAKKSSKLINNQRGKWYKKTKNCLEVKFVNKLFSEYQGYYSSSSEACQGHQ